MSWILLTEATITELLGDPIARSSIANQLPDDLPSAFRLSLSKRKQYLGRTVAVDDAAKLVVIWPSRDAQPLSLKGMPLVCIWSDPEQPTIWTIGEEDRPQALERICQLAKRVWTNQPLPEHWEAKKVEGFPSVFVSGRQLTDLRIAYLSRNIFGRQLLTVGSLYYARRQEKSARVPNVEESLLKAIPESLTPPEPDEVTVVGEEPTETEEVETPDSSDLVMTSQEGVGHHLFSLKYSEWLSDKGPLTREQRRVVAHKVQRPLRIHGPAGSGKTLVLSLKALSLLYKAQQEGTKCHVLLVAHSNEMRNTLRTALETIDDQSLMATTKKDPQFLDVETLHGWCIRELGLEFGPQYVLESDPITSRQQQQAILEEVLNDARSDRLHNLISKDFTARLKGDRMQLLRDLAWEIGIRIKGRGFGKGDLRKYADSELRSFIGKGETLPDRHFIFRVFQLYAEKFQSLGLLDTDDVVLSMANRLTSPLWNVQRKDLGYDFVLVDETHLFNENERHVLPYLTRGTTEYLPLVMTFDEAQSIGGRRSVGLKESGIQNSERQNLTYVHRSSPDIFKLASYFVDASPLIFSEFAVRQTTVLMSRSELKRCQKPQIIYGDLDAGILDEIVAACQHLRDQHNLRIGIIVFDSELLKYLSSMIPQKMGAVHYVKERGELRAAIPTPGAYIMSPEACGGLEFDAVVLAGVDEGRTPTPMGNLGREGYLAIEEEAFTELYTAITRAKYRLIIACDARRGLSSLVKPALTAGLLQVLQK
jgi:superfamily I DNA/RNA helicase